MAEKFNGSVERTAGVAKLFTVDMAAAIPAYGLLFQSNIPIAAKAAILLAWIPASAFMIAHGNYRLNKTNTGKTLKSA